MFLARSMDKGKPHVEMGGVGPEEAVVKPMHPVMWNFMLVAGVVMYSSYTIFVHLCEVDGKLPFSSTSPMLLIEVFKLVISLSCLASDVRAQRIEPPVVTVPVVVPFAVPAVIYFLNNNIAVHMQLEMDPATYQVLTNLKILSTAALYRLIIKRPITGLQWIALGLLALAGASNSFGGFVSSSSGGTSAGTIHITLKGLLMIAMYCTLSGLAGVYTEYILKKRYESSLHLQNALLYCFGIVLNGSAWFYGAATLSEPDSWNLLAGYSVYTWLLVCSQTLVGLIMSAIFKHGNNIMRLFIISCAMLVTTAMSMLIFGLTLNVYFIVSFALVVVALGLYHSK